MLTTKEINFALTHASQNMSQEEFIHSLTWLIESHKEITLDEILCAFNSSRPIEDVQTALGDSPPCPVCKKTDGGCVPGLCRNAGQRTGLTYCRCPESPCPVHSGAYRHDKAKPFGS